MVAAYQKVERTRERKFLLLEDGCAGGGVASNRIKQPKYSKNVATAVFNLYIVHYCTLFCAFTTDLIPFSCIY